jgi:protein ImuA
MPSPAPGEALCQLREKLAKLDPDRGFPDDAGLLPLGLPLLDRALQGGLARGALHELAPAVPAQFGAASGFALVLATLLTAGGRHALYIQTDFTAREWGALYGPGLDLLGLPMAQLLLLRVPRPLDVLWAFEEALKSRGVAAVVAELPAEADLTATRRLTLAAREGGGFGLLLRHRPSPHPTAATTRWEIASALSAPDPLGGLGRTAFDLSLNRNRRGRCGRFIVWWDHDARTFLPALSLAVAAAARDRPAHAQRRAG